MSTIDTIIREICESDPADPKEPSTLCIGLDDLRLILESCIGPDDSRCPTTAAATDSTANEDLGIRNMWLKTPDRASCRKIAFFGTCG